MSSRRRTPSGKGTSRQGLPEKVWINELPPRTQRRILAMVIANSTRMDYCARDGCRKRVVVTHQCKPGRDRIFCSGACRQWASRQRRRERA